MAVMIQARGMHLLLAISIVLAGLIALVPGAGAQQPKRPPHRGPSINVPVPQFQRFPPPPPALPEIMPPETVQADVSTRSVGITSSFTGTEIVVFGAVDNSRQTTAEAGLYDIVIVLEGTPTRLVARRKSNVAGIWINTSSVTFDSVPSYYAIASTRPLEEIASENVLSDNAIGFQHARMVPGLGTKYGIASAELREFRESVVRIKQKDGLYLKEDYGVAFIGRSLFRSTIGLPANVPVGPLVVHVHLFRDGVLLSNFKSTVKLEREGIERVLHTFAYGYSLWYGLFTVAVAVGAGLLASRLFQRGGAH